MRSRDPRALGRRKLSGRNRFRAKKKASRRTEKILLRFEKTVGSAGKISYYPLVAREAHGSRITDIEGREFLDFNSSWTVASLGYGNPDVVRAVSRELQRSLGLATVSIHPTELTLRFAEKLIEIVPGDYEKAVWFGHSGSDACGAAYKLIPLATKKARVISFFGGMHGVDLAGMAMGGHPATTRFQVPSLVTRVPYAYCYRCPYSLEYPACGIYCGGDFIEQHVLKYVSPPDDTSFMMVEPIQSDAGDIVPPPGYLEKLSRTCKKYGISLVVDEVKTGFGRTGKMLAVEHSESVVPDAVALGKSMGSGISVGALVARRSYLNTGFAVSTLSCSDLAASAGLATISYLRRNRVPEKVASKGSCLRKRLDELKEDHELVGDVRSKGLIAGIELVESRETRKPAKLKTVKCVYRAWELGLLVTFVGADSNVIELTPPLIIEKREIDTAVDILDRSLKDVENGLVPDAAVVKSAGF